MTNKFDFEKLFSKNEDSQVYWTERAIIEFTEELVARMKSQGVSRADLARKIGTTPPYVSKILSGETNFTLETMVKLSQALGCTLRLHLQPDGAMARWFDLFEDDKFKAAKDEVKAANCDISSLYKEYGKVA